MTETPEVILDWNKLEAKYKYYMTRQWSDERLKWICVISLGSPQRGDRVTYLCSVNLCDTPVEAEKWYLDEMAKKQWKKLGQGALRLKEI